METDLQQLKSTLITNYVDRLKVTQRMDNGILSSAHHQCMVAELELLLHKIHTSLSQDLKHGLAQPKVAKLQQVVASMYLPILK